MLGPVGSWSSLMPMELCNTPPPLFSSPQASVVTDVLPHSIKEGHTTIDPTGVLECSVLWDHGRLLALPSGERAAYGVDLLRCFMGSRRDELDAAHGYADHALAEWADLTGHVVKRFANVQISKMWEALAPVKGAYIVGSYVVCRCAIANTLSD